MRGVHRKKNSGVYAEISGISSRKKLLCNSLCQIPIPRQPLNGALVLCQPFSQPLKSRILKVIRDTVMLQQLILVGLSGRSLTST